MGSILDQAFKGIDLELGADSTNQYGQSENELNEGDGQASSSGISAHSNDFELHDEQNGQEFLIIDGESVNIESGELTPPSSSD